MARVRLVGHPRAFQGYNTWYHFTVEIDQLTREMTAYNLDGRWVSVSGTVTVYPQAFLNLVLFSGAGGNFPNPGRLWLDNLSVASTNTRISV